MKKEPLYKIDPDSEIIGNGKGVIYVTTTPDHPPAGAGKKMKDHKKTYVPKHVVVLENKMHKKIDTSKGETVHHKNEKKTDNTPSNLDLTTHEEHSKHHMKKNKPYKNSPRTKPGQKRKEAALRVAQAFMDQRTSKYVREEGKGTPGQPGYKPTLWYWITPDGKKKLVDQKVT